MAILATLIFCRYIGPFCAKIASRTSRVFGPLRYFGVDEWKQLKNKKFKSKFWIVAVYSAIIGGITHILLDLPSHSNVHVFYPWIIWQSPDFLLYIIVDFGMISIGSYQAHAQLTVYDLIWLIESLITLLISLFYLRYIKKHNLIKIWYEGIQ